MIRKIVKVPDKSLERVSKPIDHITDEIISLCNDMIDTLGSLSGYGLSAIQIGVPLRIVVTDFNGYRVFINPEIIFRSKETFSFDEGCLSIPEIFLDKNRSKTVIVRALDENGVSFEEEFSNIESVCLQHEIDHLNGVLMFDDLKNLKKKLLIQKSIRRR